MHKNIKLLVLDVDGTLTDGGIYLSAKGDEMKKFNAKDGVGIRQLMKNGIQVGLISASINKEIVLRRAEMLKIEHCYVGDDDKLEVLKKWCVKMQLSLLEIAYVGDDINDVSVIEQVGLSACPADAHFSVKEKVNVVLSLKGGEACVREFIDQYLLA